MSERDAALASLKKRRDFQNHLVVYAVINAAVWILWATTGAGYPWPAWLSGIWAVGLVLNAWDVCLRRPLTNSDVEQEISRLRATQ